MSAEGATSRANIGNTIPDFPKALRQLYNQAKVSLANEALTLATHVLMLETGFFPKDVAEEKIEEVLPTGWNAHGYIKIKYIHPTCEGSEVEVHFVTMGSSVVIHGSILGTNHVTTLPLNAYDYISRSADLSDLNSVYRNFQKLSRYFKDGFSNMLLAEMQDACGVPRSVGLASLPTDVTFYMLTFLPVKSLVAMSKVNKDFCKLSDSGFLWKRLFFLDFPDDVPADTDSQHKWKELYIEMYKKKKVTQNRLQTWRPVPPSLNRPFFYREDEQRGFRGDISLPRELQEAFPYLGRRMQSENPLLRHLISRDPWHPLFRLM